MSIESWKAKYYPIPAAEVPNDDITIVQHAIRKWEGLRPDVLRWHGIEKSKKTIIADNAYLSINAGSCALCLKYLNRKKAMDCTDCPLKTQLGYPCDEHGMGSPYLAWVEYDNPEPMIQALHDTLKMLKTQSHKQKGLDPSPASLRSTR